MNSKFFLIVLVMAFLFISCENETQRRSDDEEKSDSTIQTEEEQDSSEIEDYDTEADDDSINDDDAEINDDDTVTTEDEDIQTPDLDYMECETPGETTEEYECPDGSKVIWCICDEFYTSQCIDSPESLCETSDDISIPDEVADSDESETPDADTGISGTVIEMGFENGDVTGELSEIFRGNEFAIENGVTLKEIAMYLKPSSNITFIIYKKELSGFSMKYNKKKTYEITVSSPASDYKYYSTGEISFDIDGESWGQPSSYIIGVYSSQNIAAGYGYDTDTTAFGAFKNSISKKELTSIPDQLESYQAVSDSAYQMRLIIE